MSPKTYSAQSNKRHHKILFVQLPLFNNEGFNSDTQFISLHNRAFIHFYLSYQVSLQNILSLKKTLRLIVRTNTVIKME